MLTSRERLARSKQRPALVELHNALTRLRSTLTVMQTGAHPDDEQSGMLAYMRFGLGMRVVIVCSTRGEGGQNGLGPERTAALGVLRTREMEEAAKVLDADVVWIGHGMEDPVHDFGFSKSGPDTLARWGRERTIERMVRAYRAERPDIVIPTFLDVPGQHGHHRAMTQAAEEAIALAADPKAFPEHFAEGLTPWQVAKYYLPAWSGGGGTYDDEVPPPNATLELVADIPDFATGATYGAIGEWSRAFHASQGMGHWRPEQKSRWPLHLKIGAAGVETGISDGLPATLADLAPGRPANAAEALLAAQAGIEAAIATFPDREAITTHLREAVRRLETAQAALSPEDAETIGHRLARKRREIDAALIAAAGIRAIAWAEPEVLPPGGEGVLAVHIEGDDGAATVSPILTSELTARAATRDGAMVRIPFSVAPDAPIRNAYPPGFSMLDGNGPVRAVLTLDIGGHAAHAVLDLEEAVQIVPRQRLSLTPEATIVPLGRSQTTKIAVASDADAGGIAIASAPDISITPAEDGFLVTPQPGLKAGRHRLAVTIAGEPAYRRTDFAYPHIGRARYLEPQSLDILALDLKLPANARIGYVGGGSDRVGLWLRRMGLDVVDLDETGLRDGLAGLTSIVVGTFAYGQRPDLAGAIARLNRWIEDGGHLLTLYHRPSDGWNPDATPPRRLKIGSPSLRWRVTDPQAEVTFLDPGHKLLAGPNVISRADFAGWDKERGLYFAAEWDPAYEPLLSMHDAGEAPLMGSLLSASIGKGRHTHTSLVLHHQLDKLVPGTFRLVANLVQPA